MTLSDVHEAIERQRRFERTAQAYRAAQRHRLHQSATVFWLRLVDMGADVDANGDWWLGAAGESGCGCGDRDGRPY